MPFITNVPIANTFAEMHTMMTAHAGWSVIEATDINIVATPACGQHGNTVLAAFGDTFMDIYNLWDSLYRGAVREHARYQQHI